MPRIPRPKRSIVAGWSGLHLLYVKYIILYYQHLQRLPQSVTKGYIGLFGQYRYLLQKFQQICAFWICSNSCHSVESTTSMGNPSIVRLRLISSSLLKPVLRLKPRRSNSNKLATVKILSNLFLNSIGKPFISKTG